MDKRFFPLSKITERITVLLQPAISKQFWVKAEIASGRERGGAFYCDLIETGADGKIVAKITCTIWQRELTSIRELFNTSNMDLVLIDGTVVGFLCSLQYSPQYGLSLRVIDADPAIAMGEMELKKREIIERLQKEGLFQPNKDCFLPMLPLKIGLITSAGSAAYNDFIQTLTTSGYGFAIYLADAMMQGEQTEKSVLRALDKLRSINVELIVIARGGGSKTDLYSLDNEPIARNIASSSIPVWTGIGHEIDTSVLDYVSNKAFKTPTAAAEELVARFVQMRRQLDESANTLKTVWAYRLKIGKDHIERAKTGIYQGSRKLLDVTVSGLLERAQKLRHRVQVRISTEQITNEKRRERLRAMPLSLIQNHKERLIFKRHSLELRTKSILSCTNNTLCGMKSRFDRDRFLRRLSLERKSLYEKMATLKASDPKNVLKRGYAIVHRKDGYLVRSINDVSEKEKIYAHFADGLIISEVTAKEKKGE
ncbi:exodeoxyribonuclease 7 large subunit [Geobacter sp. OR-1]|uniref:exodeoxyribonuclease VII large subunit n=1 Tax=Geobacter sp. OR-1 TaxID=1266765 RepID=UPI000541C892|nr:exodeoxyribonuclease VII large subunit [Geobacter sp. OR-1]GAM10352.1 exodeoxyribonuclease 7 large subunit [Geobacter sp. OR-1]